MLVAIVMILYSRLPISVIYSLLFGVFLRWPFWKRWTLRLRQRQSELKYDWRTDRYTETGPRTFFVPFFKVIAATAKTNRFLTGRSFFSWNSGWKQPFQVVILTADRSLPFSVNNSEEQERIVRILESFVEHAVQTGQAYSGSRHRF
ncbi:MAG: hypothetical protein FWC43_06955 [Planctomycetaceae bacterium]|nr:hypothetical protein [Planctomycetaceae bacterium]